VNLGTPNFRWGAKFHEQSSRGVTAVRLIWVVGLLVFLGGCGAEPSEVPRASVGEALTAAPAEAATAVPHTPGDPVLAGILNRTWSLLDEPEGSDEETEATGGGWILFARPRNEGSGESFGDQAGGLAGELRGWTGCNRVAASFEFDGSQLNLGSARTTDRACPDSAWSQEEQRLLNALQGAEGVQVVDGVLVLHNRSGAPLARFRSIFGGLSTDLSP
jgi:hypothetical protein